MTIRFGRLRTVDICLFAAGAGFLHVLSSQIWLETASGAGERGLSGLGLAGWIALLVGALAVLVVPATVLRSSPATALSLDVFLSTLGLIATVAVALVLVFPPGIDGSESSPTGEALLGLILLGLTWSLGVLSLRAESRGLAPDPGASVEELVLGAERPSAARQ